MTTQLPAIMADRAGKEFRVREFEAADRKALEDMYSAFEPKRAAQGLPPETEYAIGRWLDRVLAGGQHLLVDVGGQVRGHVMLMPMSDGGGLELANFLHQDIRGRGIGTAMNRLAVSIAREAGVGRIWLSVEPGNVPAIRSYRRAGFETRKLSLWAPEIEMEIRF